MLSSESPDAAKANAAQNAAADTVLIIISLSFETFAKAVFAIIHSGSHPKSQAPRP
jgi:hypothetical protein